MLEFYSKTVCRGFTQGVTNIGPAAAQPGGVDGRLSGLLPRNVYLLRSGSAVD